LLLGQLFFRHVGDDRSNRPQDASFRLDPTTAPAQIDLEEKVGKQVHSRKGIYRVTDDELELCIDASDRPSEFKASTSAIVLRLKRMANQDEPVRSK
jgi:uncharacterized protein (TIGR03067 family)